MQTRCKPDGTGLRRLAKDPQFKHFPEVPNIGKCFRNASRSCLAIACLALPFPSVGAAATPVLRPKAAKVNANVNAPEGAMVGWAVRDAQNDSLLEGRFADRNLTPGSTQKLFTTWVALDLLGADKTFPTELFRTGALQGDRLVGDLIIRGGGDPSFADSQFAADQGAGSLFGVWLEALRKLGVHAVDGCVSGDGSYLLEEGPHPDLIWEDAGNYYAGIVSGLSFNGNLYAAKFAGAASAGKPVTLEGTLPVHSGIARFENHLLTGPTNGHDSAYILSLIHI